MMEEKTTKKPAADLRGMFLALDPIEQKRVTTFFNLHNAAMFVFEQMGEDAKQYTNYCIQLASEGQEK